jgi:2-polyprenyl-3-methyl-5-hydroxy-6-metoxy-1,4-benzoquinol methylase
MIEELTSCPVCLGSSFSLFLQAKDYTVSGEKFDIQQCNSCKFKFTNPRPKESDLGKYYKAEAYISHSDTSKGLVNRLYKLIRIYTLKSKFRLIRRNLKNKYLLDIGAGTGAFLNEVKSHYTLVRGVEPDEDAKQVCKSKYGIELEPESNLHSFENESCDVITMWHVLEHVPRLRERIAEMARIIDKNGTIYIAVPNYESYDASKYGEYWAAYDVPRHLYHFDKQSIKSLFSEFGMDLMQIHTMPFDSFYVSMLSEKYKTGRTNLLSALLIGTISLIKGRNRNTSSLIYVFTPRKG